MIVEDGKMSYGCYKLHQFQIASFAYASVYEFKNPVELSIGFLNSLFNKELSIKLSVWFRTFAIKACDVLKIKSLLL